MAFMHRNKLARQLKLTVLHCVFLAQIQKCTLRIGFDRLSVCSLTRSLKILRGEGVRVYD